MGGLRPELEDLLATAESWPLFNERRELVALNLSKLEPPFRAAVDLSIAYAMTVWQDLGCDWRRMI